MSYFSLTSQIHCCTGDYSRSFRQLQIFFSDTRSKPDRWQRLSLWLVTRYVTTCGNAASSSYTHHELIWCNGHLESENIRKVHWANTFLCIVLYNITLTILRCVTLKSTRKATPHHQAEEDQTTTSGQSLTVGILKQWRWSRAPLPSAAGFDLIKHGRFGENSQTILHKLGLYTFKVIFNTVLWRRCLHSF